MAISHSVRHLKQWLTSMIAYKGRVGVLGATSIIGEYLLPLLVEEGWDVVAFSRQARYIKQPLENCPIIWQLLTKSKLSGHQ
jgi:nucleoside-diphosphate-sugar epimerase